MTPIRLGLVGVGKIARDQHLPAIAGDPAFDLVAVADRGGPAEGLKTYGDLDALLAGEPSLEAISLCTPPVGRHVLARAALKAGKAVMLEKPPGATVSEVEQLAAMAERRGLPLYCTWHSRMAAGVEPAREWLSDRRVTSARVVWKEDVRRWHPGQQWIWEPGGLGVFDPGINALSILTRIAPEALVLEGAALALPANRQAPIAAELMLRTEGGALVEAAFDWRQTGPQIWDIEVETDGGTLVLRDGGARLSIDGEPRSLPEGGEYPNLYRRFADLVRSGRSDTDLKPFKLVADAFLLGRRRVVEPFED